MRKQTCGFLFPPEIITVIPVTLSQLATKYPPTALPVTQAHGHCNVAGRHYHPPGSLPTLGLLRNPLPKRPRLREWALTGPLTSLHVLLTPLFVRSQRSFCKKFSAYSPLAAPSLQMQSATYRCYTTKTKTPVSLSFDDPVVNLPSSLTLASEGPSDIRKFM